MAERFWLDPTEVSTGRTELEITHWVDAEGVDWGDAAIEGYMADMARGSTAVDFRVPNRQIQIPLIIKAGPGTTTFNQARLLIQRKVARIQQEGGWIKRVTSSGAIVFADLVNATLKFGGSWYQANKNFDPDATLSLEAIPDWYGAEVQLADRVETTNSELIWTEANIPGDYSGRLRLVVDNDQAGQPQMGLLWGIRSRHYSTSTTAALKYEAEACTPLDAAAVFGSVVAHSNLSTSWTPVMSTNQGAVALTHTGTYRVWARVLTSSALLPRLRLLWDVGDFATPSDNRPVTIPVWNQMCAVDLGEVRLDRVPAGIHRWQGIVQAAGTNGGENVQIDKLWFQPVDEGAGVLRAPLNPEPGLASYSARDEFNQSAGALTGKTAPVGGLWQGSGDTDDYVVNATSKVAQRSTQQDSAVGHTGRFMTLDTNLGATAVQVNVDSSTTTDFQVMSGVVARWAPGGNHLMLVVRGPFVQVIKTVATVQTSLPSSAVLPSRTPGMALTLRLVVDTSGRWFGWVSSAGGTPQLVASGHDTAFEPAGALGTGDVGIYDSSVVSYASTRTYDAFAAWVPSLDAVLHPGQSAELRTEGMFREDPTGAAYGPVTWVEGDLPRIPASGSEGRSVQFFLKASRGDLATLPDTGIDDISARVSFRPSFLFVS